ncbi:MAG: hypothetical protein K0Q82_1713 [Chryseobacterium indoltheticum]|jgi:hypothetical protein|nr:hypothetical protein [Chryseobacterium indoltheticum]
MKKLIPFLLIMLSGLSFGQNIEPVRKTVQKIIKPKILKLQQFLIHILWIKIR